MKISATDRHFKDCAGDVLLLPVYTSGRCPAVTNEASRITGVDLAAIAARHNLHQAGDTGWVPSVSGVACPDLLLVCVGPSTPDDGTASLREAVLRAARLLHRSVVICALSNLDHQDESAAARATQTVVEAFVIGSYAFTSYRSDQQADTSPRDLVLPTPQHTAIKAGSVIGEATNFARDLTNTPAADLTPRGFAGLCEDEAATHQMTFTQIDVDGLREGGFGGILGVGSGSSNPPVLACLNYGDPKAPATALVGKGITFDAGGLSIKHPLAGMVNMKDDMGGAAAVLAAMRAAAELGLDISLRAYLPLAENAVGPDAQRPGDVVRHRNGRTCEVINPDAEGRLVLADALAYALEHSPAQVVDVATLTGSTGLGPDIWGIFGTSQPLVDALLAAGTKAGDPGWQLPLWEGYRPNLRSQVADLRNHQLDMSTFWNHKAMWAALYLSEFVGTTPWAHLDIAATAFRNAPDAAWAAGSTGSGTRALVEFLRSEDAQSQP